MPIKTVNLYPDGVITPTIGVTLIDSTDLLVSNNIEVLGDNNNSTGADYTANNLVVGFTLADYNLQFTSHGQEKVVDMSIFINYVAGTKATLIVKGTLDPTTEVADFATIGTYSGPPANNIEFGPLGIHDIANINSFRFSLSSDTPANISEIRADLTLLTPSGGKLKLPKGKILLRSGKITTGQLT